jgi:hypothetical protein
MALRSEPDPTINKDAHALFPHRVTSSPAAATITTPLPASPKSAFTTKENKTERGDLTTTATGTNKHIKRTKRKGHYLRGTLSPYPFFAFEG